MNKEDKDTYSILYYWTGKNLCYIFLCKNYDAQKRNNPCKRISKRIGEK